MEIFRPEPPQGRRLANAFLGQYQNTPVPSTLAAIRCPPPFAPCTIMSTSATLLMEKGDTLQLQLLQSSPDGGDAFAFVEFMIVRLSKVAQGFISQYNACDQVMPTSDCPPGCPTPLPGECDKQSKCSKCTGCHYPNVKL